MARNFRQYLEAISPSWLKIPNGFGVRFMQGLTGYLADLSAEAATQAIKAAWVKSDTVPSDALASIGDNFNISQAPGEVNAAYKQRLTDEPGAWTLWEESATGDFAENVLAPFGVTAPSVELHTRNTWAAIQYPDAWSRFWIVIAPPIPWTEDVWGVGFWGDGPGTWGSSATIEMIAGIIRLILKWKSAHEVGHSVILNYDDHVWGAGTVWGAPGTWDINGVVRWPLSRFWDDDGVWGDIEPYRPTLPGVWGGKIVI